MLSQIWGRIRSWERGLKARFTHDIDDPAARRWSRFYTDWYDHAVLRRLWHNFQEIAPGLYRSNHPGHARLERYAAMGVTDIVNLRGGQGHAPFRFEAESCAALGLRLHVVSLSARRPVPRERLLALLDIFDGLRGPAVIHCKSGADRTGFASALYLIHTGQASVAEARKQLSLGRLHAKWTASGVLDLILERYAEAAARGVSLRDWIVRDYDTAALEAEFRAMGLRARLRL